MDQLEVNCLSDFFDTVKDLHYVVLRNADELPLKNASNDIDIAIEPRQKGELRKRLFRVMSRHSFVRMEHCRFHGIECFTFYNSVPGRIEGALKIDLFGHFEGGGVKYLDFSEIFKYREQNPNGIWVLPRWEEALLTAAKVFASGGGLKPKYAAPFQTGEFPAEAEKFIKGIRSAKLRGRLRALMESRGSECGASGRTAIVCGAWFGNFVSSPPAAVWRLLTHLSLETARLLRWRAMMCFVGPDGSGKSSVIEGVLAGAREKLRSPKERFVLFHHRPHLLCNLGRVFHRGALSEEEVREETFNPHGGKTSGYLVSMIKIVWYGIDYTWGWLFKVFPTCRLEKIVIFDRYFFDFIADQKRSALKLPLWVVRMIYKLFIPRPERVFFIKVSPEEALRRKQEIRKSSIEAINAQYENMARKYRYFRVIENYDLEKAVDAVSAEIMKAVTEPVPCEG